MLSKFGWGVNRFYNICFCLDLESGGLIYYNLSDNTFEIHQNRINDNSSISHNSVNCIVSLSSDSLVIGTNEGINLFDQKSKTFERYYYRNSDPDYIVKSEIQDVVIDNIGNLWSASFGGGLVRFNKNEQQESIYIPDAENLNSLSDDHIYSLFYDEAGILWIGTNGGGLNRYNPRTRKFEIFDENKGLLSNNILEIASDDEENIWISTNKGLCYFRPTTGEFRNYLFNTTLVSNILDRGALYKNRSGEFYYSSPSGIKKFKPEIICDRFSDAFNDKSKQQTLTHNLEVADLYEQIGRLKVENDFLKKNVRCSVDKRREWIEPDHPILSVRQ